MAKARLLDDDYELVKKLREERMSAAQLAKAREVWSAGDAIQQQDNARVWRVRSYGDGAIGPSGSARHVFVTLKNDLGEPIFRCTCKHGEKRRAATCWHAKVVARIYRIMVEQRQRREAPDGFSS
nr:MAG TPA: hypothetical protein [Caudoviricetes sp.]